VYSSGLCLADGVFSASFVTFDEVRKVWKAEKRGKEELGLRHKHESFLGDCHRTGFLLNPTNCFFFFFGGGGSNREKKAIKTWVSFLETYTQLQWAGELFWSSALTLILIDRFPSISCWKFGGVLNVSLIGIEIRCKNCKQ
jgi:hypothetical protein